MEPASAARLGHRASQFLAIFAMIAVPASAQEGGGSWSPEKPLPTPRRLLAAAEVGGAIYTFGGCGSPCFDPPVHSSTFEERRLEVYENGSWSVRKPMPAILFGAAAAPADGKVYLFGGYVTGSETYEHDPEKDAWDRKAPMPTPRHGLAAVALGGKVYVVGGSDGIRATGALEVYDPERNSWTRGAPMPTPRVFLAAVALNGRVYAIGGSPDCCGNGSTAAVEVYDPGTGRWSTAAPLPEARQVSAAVAMNGRILVFGGFVPGEGVRSTIFEYDPEADKDGWAPQGSMLNPRDQAPAVVLDGAVHLLGGSRACHCQALDTHDSYSAAVADLRILKENDPPDTVERGDTVEYTITVTNRGPAAVSGATVTDDLSATGLQGIRWCRDSGSRCTPSRTGNLNDTVSLQRDGQAIYRARGTVALTASGTFSNTARVRPPPGLRDPEPGNNVSTVTNRILPCPPPAITKTASRRTAAPGDVLRYRIEIESSCSAAVQAQVTDDLAAAGLSGVRWCRGAGCTPSTPGNLDATVALPANRPVIYEVEGTVPCSCGQTRIENTACVTVAGQPERCDREMVSIVPAPGGELEVAIAQGDNRECGPLPYTFTVTNPGPGTACGAMLQIEPPAGSALVSISSPCTGLTCGLGNVAPGAQIPITATFTSPAGLECPAALSTMASVSSCEDRDDSVFVAELPCALSITKTDGLETVQPGDPVLYTIGVKNEGCIRLSGATVTDHPFPAGLEDVKWCQGEACVPASSAPLVNIPVPSLPPGGLATYRARGTVSPGFTGKLINTATASPPGSPPASATDVTIVPGLTALCEGIAGLPFEGETIVKTLRITNGGPAVQNDNPGPEFEDELPAGLTLIDAIPSSGTITQAGNTVIWNGSIPADGTVTVEITASIDAGTGGTTLCNGGTTYFDADGNGTNESSRPTPQPCCFEVPTGQEPPPPIPGLSSIGVLIFALLLSTLGLVRLRRRVRTR